MKGIESCAVLGAAGKMGRGIACELAWYLALESWSNISPKPEIYLFDLSLDRLRESRRYIRKRLKAKAEKKIILLRRLVPEKFNCINNSDVIKAFDETLIEMIFLVRSLEELNETDLVFEAVSEDLEVKKTLFVKLDGICKSSCRFLSNTSSIPIKVLNSTISSGRVLAGFHFYNPPEVQRLVELVSIEDSNKNFLQELADSLGKTAVWSGDFPGFIGNGYFIRESTILMESFGCDPESIMNLDQLLSELCLRDRKSVV